MQSVLVDSGPLIALFDRDDGYHGPVKTFLAKARLKLADSEIQQAPWLAAFSPARRYRPMT